MILEVIHAGVGLGLGPRLQKPKLHVLLVGRATAEGIHTQAITGVSCKGEGRGHTCRSLVIACKDNIVVSYMYCTRTKTEGVKLGLALVKRQGVRSVGAGGVERQRVGSLVVMALAGGVGGG